MALRLASAFVGAVAAGAGGLAAGRGVCDSLALRVFFLRADGEAGVTWDATEFELVSEGFSLPRSKLIQRTEGGTSRGGRSRGGTMGSGDLRWEPVERWSIRSSCWRARTSSPSTAVWFFSIGSLAVGSLAITSGQANLIVRRKRVTQHPKLVIRSALSIRWSSVAKCFTKNLSGARIESNLADFVRFFASALQRSATLTTLLRSLHIWQSLSAGDGDEVRTGVSTCHRILRLFLPPVSANKKVPVSKAATAIVPERTSAVLQEPDISGLEADVRLVARCKRGEPVAWSEIYQSFHDRLQASIRPILGPMANDASLVDEIAARVWYALIRNDFELLGRFDPARGCRLSTFLGVIAKHEARQLLRSERRRRSREQGASKIEATSTLAVRELELASDEEFLATLTPSERAFYVEVLLAPEGAIPAKEYTKANAWQLTHRVKEKMAEFLFGGDVG
jgi:DNA-directed RNA polymerase specialized sigma24 family protein